MGIGDITTEPSLLLLAAERFRVLHPAVDSLWDTSFAGLSDSGIFTILDRALYAGGDSGWKRYGRFEFLTNAGKPFDGHKSFIVRRPDGRVHILYQLPDGTSGSASCRVRSFRSAAGNFVDWFGGQLWGSEAPAPSVDPLIPS
ncbi:MAG: hypothetical protein EOP86_05475 [Verrucomicrobiaceae bacterium]|nr:MAG: hypothetical protein EOP86_05475 [Verrucomicrobiaceae bacterium]